MAIRGLVRRVGAPTLALGTAMVAVLVMVGALLAQSAAANRMEGRAAAAAAEARAITESSLLLLNSVTDAETGQRGYLLTGRPEFLRPYEEGRRGAAAALRELARLSASDPALARRVAEIERRTARRVGILAQTIELAGRGRREEALAFLPEGLAVMEDLRGRVGQVLEAARARERLVRAERVAFDQRSARLQVGLAVATVLALVLAIAALAYERIAAGRAATVRARMTAEVEAARARAVEADAAKSRFLAAASHDMRQPLHALALYISTLERRIESEQGREILASMDSAVRSMSRLFTALLDLARLEAGILKPDPIAFDVHDLLEEVAGQAVDPRGGRAKVRVVPTTLKGFSDPDLLEIALRNLVSNAVKHSKGGRVLLGCRRTGEELRVEVHDDGEGIPGDQLERLFSEFVRGEQAGSTEGVGLGLAIVERLAKLLGHRLSVRSQVGRGTVFGVTLPRAREAAAPVPEPAPMATLSGMKVLLADDEPLALDAMRRTLEDAGAVVTATESAAAARRVAADSFDLYVLDLNLGRDDGLELLRELETLKGERLPALFVTGATTSEMLERLRGSGRAWLTKPVTVAALTAAAAEALSGS